MSVTESGRVSVPEQSAPQASSTPQPGGRTRTDTVRDALHAGACVLSGVLVTIGFLLDRDGSEADEADELVAVVADAPERFYAGNLLAAFGLVLVAAAGLAVLRLVRGRGRVLATVGGVLTMIGGTAAAAGIFMYGAVVATLTTELDAEQAAAAQEALADSGRTGLTFIVGFPGTFLGLLLCAVALFVSRATPRWVPAALVLGIVAVMALGSTDASTLGDLLLTAGLAGIGLSLWKAVRPA
jgi:hypothetical protein